MDTHAASYLTFFPISPGQAAEATADWKKAKYSPISTYHWFILVAGKTMGPINQEGSEFLDELGNRFAEIGEDPESTRFSTKELVL